MDWYFIILLTMVLNSFATLGVIQNRSYSPPRWMGQAGTGVPHTPIGELVLANPGSEATSSTQAVAGPVAPPNPQLLLDWNSERPEAATVAEPKLVFFNRITSLPLFDIWLSFFIVVIPTVVFLFMTRMSLETVAVLYEILLTLRQIKETTST